MNQDFLRLLARRLEQVPWVDVRLSECTFQASFPGVDGFFMGADLMTPGGTSGVFGFRGRRLGSIAAWTLQLVQEQGGYHDEKSQWVPLPDGVSVYEVDQLAWRALDLGGPGDFEGAFLDFVLDGPAADSLLSPPFLYGRMRGIGPGTAAAVLRRCADGMAPQGAWALAAQELRVSRLRKLADVLESAPHTVVAAWDEPTPDWSFDDLHKLTHFSMLSRYRPSVMPDGGWCGDLAMWTWKLYGADADAYFGKEANVGLAASVMLGLTPCEGAALFEAKVSPNGPEEFDELAFCAGLTPDLAARALRGIGDGVFPSLMWNDLQFHVGLDEWLEDVLGYNPWDGNGSLPEQGG